MPAAPPDSRLPLGLALGWLAAGAGVGYTGAPEAVPQLALWLGVAALCAAAVGAVVGVPRLRAWAEAGPLRPLVLVHLVRFTALGYVGLAEAGAISGAFAYPAAIAESAVALSAVGVAAFAVPLASAVRWRALLFWNVFGAAALLAGALRAALLGVRLPMLVAPLLEPPYAVVPLAVFPLCLAAHAAVFVRLWATRQGVSRL